MRYLAKLTALNGGIATWCKTPVIYCTIYPICHIESAVLSVLNGAAGFVKIFCRVIIQWSYLSDEWSSKRSF